MSLVMKRKSIRQYTDEQVSNQDIKQMLKSAMQAPSACNQQPWEFVVVKDRNTLDELSEVSKGAWMLSQAPLCITVIIKDTEVAPKMAQQDCGACVENILLEATNLGLGACWIGVYPIEDRLPKVNEILNIKDGNAFCNIAIGHPKGEYKITERFDESRVHYEKVN